jgi:dissimilatory sulfite reductase (desulfoviridin) alpha/beta subunit
MAEKFEEKEHEKLIRVLKAYLEKNGYEVNIEKTTEYAGAKADMEATKDKEKLCIEVVNGKNINTPETKRKWEAISGNRNCEFCLFAPEEKMKEIEQLLEKWAIYYRKLWTYSP